MTEFNINKKEVWNGIGRNKSATITNEYSAKCVKSDGNKLEIKDNDMAFLYPHLYTRDESANPLKKTRTCIAFNADDCAMTANDFYEKCIENKGEQECKKYILNRNKHFIMSELNSKLNDEETKKANGYKVHLYNHSFINKIDDNLNNEFDAFINNEENVDYFNRLIDAELNFIKNTSDDESVIVAREIYNILDKKRMSIIRNLLEQESSNGTSDAIEKECNNQNHCGKQHMKIRDIKHDPLKEFKCVALSKRGMFGEQKICHYMNKVKCQDFDQKSCGAEDNEALLIIQRTYKEYAGIDKLNCEWNTRARQCININQQ